MRTAIATHTSQYQFTLTPSLRITDESTSAGVKGTVGADAIAGFTLPSNPSPPSLLPHTPTDRPVELEPFVWC
jgi:hypothetical protein